MKMRYKTNSYRTMAGARKKQIQMKKVYGYKPTIFKISKRTGTRKTRYVVVKPRSLIRI